MKNGEFLSLDKEVLNLIVMICFDVSELRHLFQTERIIELVQLIRCDDEIRNAMDRILGSFNIRELTKNILASRENIENNIRLYCTINFDFENKSEIIKVLQNLDSHLITMQEKIDMIKGTSTNSPSKK